VIRIVECNRRAGGFPRIRPALQNSLSPIGREHRSSSFALCSTVDSGASSVQLVGDFNVEWTGGDTAQSTPVAPGVWSHRLR